MATLFGGGMDEQAMQRQLINQRAAEFAQLNPSQRLAQMGYSAGASLGGGLAKAMGVDVTDPTIKRASMLRSLASKYDTTTPEGLTQLAQELRSVDPDMAMQVGKAAQDMRLAVAKVGSEEALTKQRSKEETAADPFQKLLEKGVYKPSSLAAFKQSGDVGDLQFKDSDVKTEVIDTAEGQKLINSNTGATIANLGKKPVKKSIGTDIAEGLSPTLKAIGESQAKKAGEAAGTVVGKATADIQGKYTALNSVADALGVLKKGIYAGGYGPLEEGMAKYSKGVLADKQRLVNTEEFRAYIGDVVIPRLTEFGGNDSVEELKYLRSVMAGDTTMESKSIEKILNNAQKKIQAGIDRIKTQQEAVIGGKPLPIGPVGKMQQRTTRSGLSYTVEGE